MFVLDKPGLRSREINGVEVNDFREIAEIFTENPKYKDKSIYLVPDNFIHDITTGVSRDPLTPTPGFKGQDVLSDDELDNIVGESKSKSGRSGRKIRKTDYSILREALKENMPEEDLHEYMSFLASEKGKDFDDDRKKAISKTFKKSKELKQKLEVVRELNFPQGELDWHGDCGSCDECRGSKGAGSLHHGELIPLPITNFNEDQINRIRLGKTTFFLKRFAKNGSLKPKEVTILGDRVDDLISGGYNNEEVIYKENPSEEEQVWNPRFQAYTPTGEEMVEITYIYGPNRSGKTYYAAKYADRWSSMFKEWPIYLFSRREKDKVLDDIPAVSRVAIDEKLISEPLSMTDFEHSLVIFDDIDTIPDKKMCKALQKLRDDIMETGRQKMIYVINTSHLGANWAPTRTVLNEANSYTLFPRKGNYEHNFNILKGKMGMKPAVIKSIMDRPNGLAHLGKWGWITAYKDSPQYVIYENGVRLL